MFETDIVSPSPALLCHVENAELRGYIQRFSFATGPDAALNARMIRDLNSCIERRHPSEAAPVSRKSTSDHDMSETELAHARRMGEAVQLTARQWRNVENDLAWKMSVVPRDAESVMVVGCGFGSELIFLRAVLPHARITAYDWDASSLHPQILDVTDTTYATCNFVDRLAASRDSFDLLFSNHVLEHQYDPDHVLRVFHERLSIGGALVSALPLEAMLDGVLTSNMLELVTGGHTIHPFDMMLLSPGHCWKTNPSDVRETLHRAGFGDCALYQRVDFPSRYLRVSRSEFDRRTKVSQAMYRALFRVPERAAERVTRWPSRSALKAWFALQSRSPYGALRLHNELSDEILVCAKK